jgi:ankyrin repeat protein
MKPLSIGVLAVALTAMVLAAAAQVPPSATEIAAYDGLHAAANRGDVAEIERLVNQSPELLESSDQRGRTPLHIATFARQRHAIKALIKMGANHGALEQDRYDAVTIAAVANDEESLCVLLAAGASAKLVTSRYDGTALIAAAHLGHSGIVRQLIAAGAPLDHVNNLHWTAVIEAIVLGDGGVRHQNTLQALLDAGANVQLSDREGRSPLQLAQARGYETMVRALKAAQAESSGQTRSPRPIQPRAEPCRG